MDGYADLSWHQALAHLLISSCTVHVPKNVDFISVLRKKPQFSFCTIWHLRLFSETQVILSSAQNRVRQA